ncbi:MAG: DedA family protein [Elusimicrobiota bacterium]
MIARILGAVHAVYNVRQLIQWGGVGLVCAIVFSETGLFFGFFLPGDSLLVSAGIFARAGDLPLLSLSILAVAAAILGNQTGYALGRSLGRRMMKWPDSVFFKQEHLARTHEFYARYGAKTIFLARFIPIIRTFAPLVGGIAAMSYVRFLAYTAVGALAWAGGLILSGYCLAAAVPDIGKKIHWVILAVIAISLLPAVFEIWRSRARKAAE